LFAWHHEDTERKMVPVSTNLFPIVATAFLVVLAVVFVVFTAKYIRTRARGRGPLEMFSQPRPTFAQYDDDDDDEGEGIDTEEGGAKTGRENRQKLG
jgi:hypothetical protein